MNQAIERKPAAVVREPALRRTLALDYLACCFGRFTLMPVLAIMLAAGSGGAAWASTGIGLFGFMLCAGLAALPATRWLPKFPYVVSLPASMVFSAVGFGLLPYTHHAALTMTLLFLGAFGISVHATLVRVLVREVIAGEPGRNTIYSIQQIATNAAAAVGPFAAGVLYVAGDARPLLAVIALAYVLAGVTLLAGLPRGLRPSDALRERVRGPSHLLATLRGREARRTSLITVAGAFVYAQFYSAFALLVGFAVDSALLRGALLAGPPVAIALLQTPVTVVANRFLRTGVRPVQILALATLVFGVAMLLLGLGLPVVVAATAAMAVFAVAEMLFTPMVSTAFSRLPGPSALAASNLQGVAWTTGEALGSLCGGALFLLGYHHGAAQWYWLGLAVLASLAAVPYLTGRRSTVD
ncbi:MFS transporter [Amycolatopsis sp. NPDC049688]|uniref:MFS transporter n=1 Tax=Amycolatopsis sp. NPDC049688 TaxID=3154733 RepID=UPI003441044E